MSSKLFIFKRVQRYLLVMFVAGGTLFQTSCSTLATDIAVGALSSVTSTYITYSVYEWLGLGEGMLGLGGL
ncbi:MAG: hypothetical protein GXY44_14395 [Phycisphaerales bacterium]|nr:hypothetical protein [Phycisphaerales bacterium]